MNKEELEFILQEGEGYKIEFKEGFDAKGIAKEITAFANSSGGRILIGVSDKGEVKGLSITNKIKSQIQDIARNCDPSIEINLEGFENVLIIDVPEGKNKPYKCSDGFYLRQGPNSQKLSRDEILSFAINVGKIKFDEQISDKFKFPEDFDENKFNDFLKRSRISNIGDKQDILVNLFVAVKIGNKLKLNNAGLLFFGKNISKFIRQNFLTCVLYKGKERVNIIDRKDFNDDLINNYENSLKFLKQHLRLEYIIKGGGPRQEVLELPEEALKEALLNALAHRDYFESGTGIFIEMFDNRVEIYNKGKLLFNKKDLGKISLSRNPIIFDLFYGVNLMRTLQNCSKFSKRSLKRQNLAVLEAANFADGLIQTSLIEKAGSGINRINELVRERGLKIRFETDEFFRIIFERPELSEETTQKTREKEGGQISGQISGQIISDREKEILNLIKENPRISREELSEKIKINPSAVQKHISKLKKKGVLRRTGPDKGGYWKVKDVKNEEVDK